MSLPIGLDGLAARLKEQRSEGTYWISATMFRRDEMLYRCRYCLAVLITRDDGCATCGAPKDRQHGPT